VGGTDKKITWQEHLFYARPVAATAATGKGGATAGSSFVKQGKERQPAM